MSADGTVTTIYDRASSESFSYFTGGGETNQQAWIEHTTTSGSYPEATTSYYLADQLDSTRMMLAYGGWPLSTDTYYPYGQEPSPPADNNHYRFAGLERDAESGLDHTQFRQYASEMGRWMSPDPYMGSYDPSNPQTFNRYSYVLNRPFTFADPSGLIMNGNYCGDDCPNRGDGGGIISILGALGRLFGDLFGGGGPSFHGSMKPRPNYQPWDEYQIHYGPNIAGAFGLPNAGCEFGACGSGALKQTPIKEDETLAQKIADLRKAGVYFIPFETALSPFHKGQITLRDKKWLCSRHVTLDKNSGRDGRPVTGESHRDLFNPWKLPFLTTVLHAEYDLAPDKIEDKFPWFPTGSDLCRLF